MRTPTGAAKSQAAAPAKAWYFMMVAYEDDEDIELVEAVEVDDEEAAEPVAVGLVPVPVAAPAPVDTAVPPPIPLEPPAAVVATAPPPETDPPAAVAPLELPVME